MNCLLCGGRCDREIARSAGFRVLRCSSCRAAFTHPVPDDLSPYYPPTYGPHQAGEAPAPRTGLRRVIDSLATVIPPLRPGSRVLEIGCGSGGFLHLLRSSGFDAEGVEPAVEAARLAGARPGEFDPDAFPAARFDAVFAWMVLEHARDPLAMLRGIARILRPRGWLALSVPNLDSWEFSFFRDSWHDLECPRHLTHFPAGSLRGLLPKLGYADVRILHQRSLSSAIGSIWPRYPQRPNRILQAALYPLSCVIAALRQSGRITVLARRAG